MSLAVLRAAAAAAAAGCAQQPANWARALAAVAGGSGSGGRPSKEQVVRIDRSGLMPPAYGHEHGEGTLAHKEPETEMARHIKALIRVRRGLAMIGGVRQLLYTATPAF